MSNHNMPLSILKRKITLYYPKYNDNCSYGFFSLGTHERVPNSRGKRAIGVRVIQILMQSALHVLSIFFM